MKQPLITTIAVVLLAGCGKPNDIWKAALKGDLDTVKHFIAYGTDVNAKDDNGFTVLQRAVHHKEIVEVLIDSGADVNAVGFDGETPLHSAANIEIVELLISKGAEVNALNNGGQTPLHMAALDGSKEIAEILLSHGSNLNHSNDKNTLISSPLHCAVIGKSVKVVDLFLSKGAEININSNHYGTPFDLAVILKNDEIAELLREKGGKSGSITSVFTAAYLGKTDGLKKHLAKGWDINAKFNNETPLHFAVLGGRQECVEFLISKGANLDAAAIDGTPLNYAARNANAEIVEYLILKGANVNSLSEKDMIIETALDYTLNEYNNALELASDNYQSISKEGIKYGETAKLLQQFDGKSASEISIHAAALFGDVLSVKKFIAKGINVNSESLSGNTPLDYALKQLDWVVPEAPKTAKKEIAALLRKHGGKTYEELKDEGN